MGKKSVLKTEAAAESAASPSFWARSTAIAQRNPWVLWSLLHYEYQINLGYDLNRRLYPEKSFLPSYVSISPTRQCNLKCKMCIQHRRSKDKAKTLSWYKPDQELPLDAWITLFEELTKWRPIVFITGGEPLLYSHILELIEEAKKRDLLVHLQTNGILLAKIADHLVKFGVDMVTVSLDGPPAVHDLIRGKGTFQKSAEGFRALVEARDRQSSPSPLMDIRCTILKDNLNHLGEMVAIAQELGADLLSFTHAIFSSPELVECHNRLLTPDWAEALGLEMIPPSIPKGEYFESEIGPEAVPLLQTSFEDIRRRAQGSIKVQFSPNLPDNLIAPYYLDLEYPFPQVCKSLWKNCRILPDGTISPCLHLVMGNITKEPLRVVWNNPKMQRLRKVVSKNLFPGCVRCCHRSFV